MLQTLITQFEVTPRYWTQTNPPYEVDFLIQRENDIFPVEVKSETNTTSKSLKKFKELFPNKVKLRVMFSLDNLKLDEDVLNIPLFIADHTDRLIGWHCSREMKSSKIIYSGFYILFFTGLICTNIYFIGTIAKVLPIGANNFKTVSICGFE